MAGSDSNFDRAGALELAALDDGAMDVAALEVESDPPGGP